MLERLLDGFRRHERLALARLLSLLARGEHSAEIRTRVGNDSENEYTASLALLFVPQPTWPAV